ncbi:MAG: penicillin-binding transpeptidase domain-containing protein [Planctomycetota bacterium]
MISGEVFRSESGFRPMSAFVVVAIVLAGVGVRVANVALADEEAEPAVAHEAGLAPAFELVDAGGRSVAHFVDRLDLVLSPRSMWLAHTPDYMSARIAEAVGGVGADEVLTNVLPDVRDGWADVADLPLSARQASMVLEWVERGGVEPDDEAESALAGIDVVPVPASSGAPRYQLRWQPSVLLSRSEREAHGVRGPAGWTRRLLDGLAGCVSGRARGEVEPGVDPNEECRRFLWARMMPTGHCVAVRDVPAERALAIEALLREEGVSPLQMRLTRARDRRYPAGELEILGSWGRIQGNEPEPLPRAGLELVAERVFGSDEWPVHEAAPATYSYFVHRNRALGRTQYFIDRSDEEEPPRVVTTLDLDLLRAVRRELARVMDEHAPAVAMGIVIELQSGDVLAIDSLEKVPVQPFAPVYYAFTPGSTFKMVTMAAALEERAVRPEELLDVGRGHFRLEGSSRVIHEAEGSLTGSITAAQSFAFSVNAGLVQIGQRVPAEKLRAKLRELGYAAAPQAGLGPEHAGYVPPLPWKLNWTHASISFGHELLTTLWQHVGALATIVRGGVWKPLRLIEAVEQDGQRIDLPLAGERRVFREDTCRIVRGMMEVGAIEGTGRDLSRPDVVMGTKTGTAEKVPTEVCSHVAAAARERFAREGRPFTAKDFAALRGAPRPHRSCYTSSMCVVGRLTEDPEERELLVLVVVDEPTGKEKFGSKVAGPAATRILREALGLTRGGAPTVAVTEYGFALSGSDLVNLSAEPWRLR